MTRSHKKLKARFAARGESITQWAKEHGYNLRTVYAVIGGEIKATRGVSHRIAVDLGLKPDPETIKQAA